MEDELEDYVGDSVEVLDTEMRDGYFAAVKKSLSAVDPLERTKALGSFRFVLLNFNDYFVTNVENGIPAEVGGVVFSLEDGILREYCTLIDPRIQSLMGSASDQLEASHGLPPPMYEDSQAFNPFLKQCSTSEYTDVLNRLYALMAFANKTLPKEHQLVCFTVKRRLEIVRKCVEWIMHNAGHANVKIYAAEELMTALFGMSDEEKRNRFEFRLNRYRLSKPQFSPYRTMHELACPWHQQNYLKPLAQKCAMHQTRDQTYRLIQGLLKGFLVTPQKGIHFPDPEDRGKIVNRECLSMTVNWVDVFKAAEPSDMLHQIEQEMRMFEFEQKFADMSFKRKQLARSSDIITRESPRIMSGVPRREGDVPRRKAGVLRREDGVPRREDGVPRREDGVPRREDGVPRMEDGVPRREDGVPRRKAGVIRREEGVRLEVGVARRQVGLFEREDGVPRREVGLLGRDDGVPRREVGLLGRDDGVPRRKADLLGREDGVPRREVGLLGREEVEIDISTVSIGRGRGRRRVMQNV